MEELSAELLDAVRLKLEDESRGKLSDSGQGGDAGVGDDAVSFMMLDTILRHIRCVAVEQSLVGSSSSSSCDRRVSSSGAFKSFGGSLSILAPKVSGMKYRGFPRSKSQDEQSDMGKWGNTPFFEVADASVALLDKVGVFLDDFTGTAV